MQNLNVHMSSPFKSFFGIFRYESEGHLRKLASLGIVQNESEEATRRADPNISEVGGGRKGRESPCFSDIPSFYLKRRQ